MINVIPVPLHVAPRAGQFRFRSNTRVEYSDPSLAPIVKHFCQEVARRTGLQPKPAHGGQLARAVAVPFVRVEFACDPEVEVLPAPTGVSPTTIPSDERYSLVIEAGRVVVRSSEPAGIARGLTTLLQLLATTLPDSDGVVSLPAAQILDAPRFAWRSLTLDLVRAFFTINEVKRIIDLIALYKFNVLHLHLTDDQAWRIKAGRPEHRRHTDSAFYTNAELRELVAYGEQRFLTLVPEVDTPGHATALMQMHPELDTGQNRFEFNVAPRQIQRSAWLDPDRPATFAVIESVMSEIAAIFPGRFINIGGDEPFGMPEHLYVKYVNHLRSYVRSLGKCTMGWQESIRAGAESSHVIQYWISSTRLARSSPEGARKLPPDLEAAVAENIARAHSDIEQALKHSVPIIVTPVSHAYFDVPYAEPSADPAQESIRRRLGLPFYTPKTVAETFDWEPVQSIGPDARPENVAGVGGAIWTETIKDFAALTFMLLPRLPGVAQKAWSNPRETWTDHRDRLAAHGRLWAQDDLRYFKSSSIDWALDTNVKRIA